MCKNRGFKHGSMEVASCPYNQPNLEFACNQKNLEIAYMYSCQSGRLTRPIGANYKNGLARPAYTSFGPHIF